MRPADYLAHYATRFDTVEIDATFYRTPTEKMADESIKVTGYFNNHYAGNAIGSIQLFREMWDQGGDFD